MEITENIEEYLEIIWIFNEKGTKIVKINEIADKLGISPPSAVEMLKKMAEMGLVIYETRKGIKFTKNGKKKAMNIIRNRRLAELLLTEVLNMEIDDEAICGFEHHISREIADAICKLLNHPRFCPHKNEIPKGKCCF